MSADRKVLEMGLFYAKNVVAQGWMADMALFLFGPSEVTIATDPDPGGIVADIIVGGTTPRACKWCSDKHGVSAMLEETGCTVEYVGSPTSEAIKQAYTLMTW